MGGIGNKTIYEQDDDTPHYATAFTMNWKMNIVKRATALDQEDSSTS